MLTIADHSPGASGVLLLVDGDDESRRALQLMLQARGFAVQSFASAHAALADPACDDAVFLVVQDSLPDARGAEVLEALRARGWNGRAVLMADSTTSVAPSDETDGFLAVLDNRVRRFALLMALAKGEPNRPSAHP